MPCIEDEIRSLLAYDPESGLLRWKERWNPKIREDMVAGTISQGYVYVCVRYRRFRAHRIAWLLMTGDWPAQGTEIDHINGIRNDNRWCNLRALPRKKNCMNSGIRSNNKSGKTGVSFVARSGKWDARITADGVLYLLGQYASRQEAIEARTAAEKTYFGEYRNRDDSRRAIPRGKSA